MTARVLLLDTAFAARPIHDWLLEQRFEVWTIGNRPDDVLARRDPAHYLQDNYANITTVQRHVDRLEIQHVVPGCTDISIETAQRLRVPATVMDSAENYAKIADKGKFRAICEELDLPAPRRIPVEDLPVAGRLIAKPMDSFSGHGISVFDGSNREAGLRALEFARDKSRTGGALIETFADGALHSYSCFLEDQEVVDATVVREEGSITPYAVDTSHVAWAFPTGGCSILKDSIERLARHLSLVDGLLHVQFIWDGEKPWLIELSRRCPGDLYPWLVELSTGKRHAARYASYFVGRHVATPTTPVRRHILRHTVTAGHNNYEGLWFNRPTPVVEFHPLAAAGREAPPENRIDRTALVFSEFPSETELLANHLQFLNRVAYRSHNRPDLVRVP